MCVCSKKTIDDVQTTERNAVTENDNKVERIVIATKDGERRGAKKRTKKRKKERERTHTC